MTAMEAQRAICERGAGRLRATCAVGKYSHRRMPNRQILASNYWSRPAYGPGVYLEVGGMHKNFTVEMDTRLIRIAAGLALAVATAAWAQTTPSTTPATTPL